MKKIHITWIIVLLSGCTKFNDFHYFTDEQIKAFSATLPDMYMQYGDDKVVDFTIAQVLPPGNVDTSDRHVVTIYAATAVYAMIVRVPGDTLSSGNYRLDGIHGTVTVLRNGNYEIGTIGPSCFFDLFLQKEKGRVTGQFSGVLLNRGTGKTALVTGGMANIIAN